MRTTPPGWGLAIDSNLKVVWVSLLWPTNKRKLSPRNAAACTQLVATLDGKVCHVTEAGSGSSIP